VSAGATVAAVLYARSAARSSANAANAAHDTVFVAEESRAADERERQRRRIEEALARIREMMDLARRLYQQDPLTTQLVGSDESALPPLQDAIVAFRAHAELLPLDELPHVQKLTEMGVRQPKDAAWLRKACMDAIDDLRAALARS